MGSNTVLPRSIGIQDSPTFFFISVQIINLYADVKEQTMALGRKKATITSRTAQSEIGSLILVFLLKILAKTTEKKQLKQDHWMER